METSRINTLTADPDPAGYSVEISGPDLYLSVNLVSRAHMHLVEAALDIVRVDQAQSPQQPANDATES